MLTVYKSSAGAGKTFTLAGNYIDLLFAADGRNRHKKILAVTFTKKATAEMKDRIVTELNKLANGEQSDHAEGLKARYGLSDKQLKDKSKELLLEILQDYGSFAVSTIDSFFQQIIRSFAKEMNLQGAYNLELDSESILRMAVDDFFFNLPENIRDEKIRALIQIIEENIDDGKAWNPKETILELSKELLSETYQTYQPDLVQALKDSNSLDEYRAELRLLVADYMKRYGELEKRLGELLGGFEETDFSYGTKVFAPFHWKEQDVRKALSGDKSFGSLRDVVLGTKNLLKKKPLAGQDILVDALCEHGKKLLDMLEGEEAIRCLTAYTILRYLNYLKILQDISYYIHRANEELNRLPLSETNKLLNDVIADSGDAPFVYDKIGTRIAHYMIDEFQDTSGMQWANFRPLVLEAVSNGRNSMLVGDVKQSIYRWRNSDSGLLQYGVNKDFSELTENILDTNWRSDKVVVEENNTIFKLMAKEMQADFNRLYGIESNKIADIYTSVEQRVHKEESGYVRIEFVGGDKKDERHREMVGKLPQIVKDAANRGVKYGKIAVLIRKNDEASEVAEILMGAGIPVMSNEALLICRSASVRLVIDLLRMFVSAKDKVLELKTAYDKALCEGKTNEEALNSALQDELNIPKVEMTGQLGELVDKIVRELGLNENDSERVYLQAFADEVYAYEQKYPNDIFSFLEWWDVRGEKAAIQMTETDDAVQIVSIHKSKGLEYDVVIVPFCDWDKSISQNHSRTDILWVKPRQKPFDRLPIVPVKFGKDLGKTYFRDDYLKEIENLYVDNLNLAYVAFTRAKRELYVLAPEHQYEQEKKTIGEMLYGVLQDRLHDNVYERGEKVHGMVGKNGAVSKKTMLLPYYEGERAVIAVKLPSRNYFESENNIGLCSRVNIGTLMHEILCQVISWGDECEVVRSMIDSGRLCGEDIRIVENELRRVKELTATTNWFDKSWKVKNECEIILEDGQVRRPDRLLIADKKAVIVDWKFGYMSNAEYITQVQEYMNLMEQMGYETEGWLCYVNKKEIIKVEKTI